VGCDLALSSLPSPSFTFFQDFKNPEQSIDNDDGDHDLKESKKKEKKIEQVEL